MSDDSDFKYIIRIANTDVSGEERLASALTSIRGIGARISNAIVKKLELIKLQSKKITAKNTDYYVLIILKYLIKIGIILRI